MIINFYNVGGGGGGGTTNYNQLENKPQINGVTLSGNVSSDQLGITLNELKAVENVPSAATNGSVFSEYREEEIGYGWQEPNNTTGNTFHYLNTYDVEQYEAHLADFTYNNEVRDIVLYGDNRRILFGYQYTTYSGDLLQVERGATGSTEAWEGVYVIVNFTNVDLPEISFVDGNGDPVDVVISNEVTPYSEPLITKDLKQAYNQEIAISRWDKYSHYEGRYQLYQFKPLEGFSFPSEKTFIGQVYYYDIVIKGYANSGETYAVDCSTDSGETWTEYVIPCDGESHQYSLTGSSTAKVMNATFKAEYFPAGPGGDYGYFNIEADKFMWEDNLVVLTKNVLLYDQFLKSGASYNVLTNRPSINGNELAGNKTTEELGLKPYVLYTGAEKNWTLQKEVDGLRALNWQNVSNIGFSIDFDGSDMPLSFYWENDFGENGQTPYFSGGTWYNTEGRNLFKLSNGKFYFRGVDGTKLTGIAQGSITSAVTFYKDINLIFDGYGWVDSVGTMITVYNSPSNDNNWYTFVSGASRNVKLDNVSDGNLTINYGDNLEETVEISGGQIVAGPDWTWENDHYYKYTPDLGKLMIFNYGSLYWEIRGGSGKLFINNPDVNGLASSISAKEAYNGMFGPYVYNDVLWEKV